MAIACSTRSGTLVGPGICRKWRPVWPVGWFLIATLQRGAQCGGETPRRQAAGGLPSRGGLRAQRHFDRGAIVPPGHQAILEDGLVAELADQDDPGDRQDEDHDKAHQRRRAALGILVLV